MSTADCEHPASRSSSKGDCFEHALVERDSTAKATTFRLSDLPVVRDWVLDLIRREALCCPFLSYEVDAEDDQVVWTTTGLGSSDMAVLDDFLGKSPEGEIAEAMAQRLTELGGVQVIAPVNAR